MAFSIFLPFLYLSFILGIIIASFFSVEFIYFFILSNLSFIFIFFLYKNKKVFFIGILILILVFGYLRYNYSNPNLSSGNKISIKGEINSFPKETEKVKIFKINGISIITDKYDDYNYGDKLIVKGILNDSSSLFFPEIERIGQDKNMFYEIIFGLRKRLKEIINKNFSYTNSAILSALLIGDKDNMSSQIKESLNFSGLRHITAISGMHIALIGYFIMVFLLAIGISRNISFYISAFFLLFFVILIGFPSSAIRAFIMGVIYMFSKKIGRMNNASTNLLLTASIMLLLNPFLIKDYGFNLSFLAVLGIINLVPLLEEKIKIFRDKKYLRELIFITISAYIFTFPYLLYNFQEVSLISILSNLVVVPLVYPIMVFGFLFLISNIIFPFISVLFFIPLYVLISIFVFLVNIFSKFPHIHIDKISIFFPIIVYSIIFIYLYSFKKRKKYVRI